MKHCRTIALGLMLGAAVTGIEARATEPAAPAVAAESQTQSAQAMDPALRALLIGIAASALREAAASPDPVAGLGNSLERTFASLLRSPATMQLVTALVGTALKEAPAELREPLALFARSVAEGLRRDLLGEPGAGRVR